MTTTAYDTHFIASDTAFTDSNGSVTYDIPFRKVKRIDDIVVGMAGCLDCMIDFCDMIVNYVMKNQENLAIPLTIIERQDRSFVALVYVNGNCLYIKKDQGQSDIGWGNVTNIPLVIGSGSQYTQSIIDECPNSVVVVLEAMKKDNFTGGEVKYCSVLRDDIHNLEIAEMSTDLGMQITGLQAEIKDAKLFAEKSSGLAFTASTETYYSGRVYEISSEVGMQMLKDGFSAIRDKVSATKA